MYISLQRHSLEKQNFSESNRKSFCTIRCKQDESIWSNEFMLRFNTDCNEGHEGGGQW